MERPSLKLKQVSHGSRRQAIVQRMLHACIRGAFQPGERLTVQRLASQMGVSATPIREALVELAGIGIVELLPNRGAVLCPFGRQQIREICQLRRLLESEAARCACGRVPEPELRGLERELVRLVDAPRDARWSNDTRVADSRLHELITAHSASDRLAYEIGRYASLWRALRDVVHERRQARDDFLRMEENSEHLAIVRGLLAGEPDAAAEAMSHHIRMAAQNLEHELLGPVEPARAATAGP